MLSGTIPAAAVTAFLDRRRDSFEGYKALTPARIEHLVQRLPKRPAYWDKLKAHQKLMVLIGARYRRFAFFAATGTGKTLVALSLIHWWNLPALVLVPNVTNKDEWADEIAKHDPSLDYLILDGSSLQKQLLLSASAAPIVIETYPGMVRMLSGLVANDDGDRRLKPKRELVAAFCRRFGTVIFDESTQAKTKGSLTSRIATKLSEHCPVIYTLTGTPMGHDPTDLWQQMFLIDRGWSLGETLGLFRSAFFHVKKGRNGFPEYAFDGRKEAELHRVLAHRSIRIRANEADLPDRVAIRKYVRLPEEAEAYHQRAIAAIKAARGSHNIRELRNVFTRLRQMSSGYIGYDDDESGERCQFAFEANPKLDLLLSLLLGIGETEKAIIFYHFTWSGLAIAKRLTAAGRPFAHLWGGARNSSAELAAFKDPHGPPRLLIQHQFGLGLNLQIGRYGLFYESPLSGIVRQQCEARYVRQYSRHERVFIYDLLCRGTVDEAILRSHEIGADLAQGVLDGRLLSLLPRRAG